MPNTTFYISEGLSTLAEYNQAGALKAEYIYGADGVIAEYDPAVTGFLWYYKDHLGSTRQVNAAGYTDYYPFGQEITNTSLCTDYKFTGKEQDATGLYYGACPANGGSARYYDPAIGRFLSIDPLAEKYPFITPYNYCGNNLLIFIDPDGREWDVTFAFRDPNKKVYLDKLINDLSAKTGLTYNYETTKDGRTIVTYNKKEGSNDAVVATDKNGNDVGSSKARDYMTALIDKSDVVVTDIVGGSKSSAGLSNNSIRLNFEQIEDFIAGTSSDLDNTTLGWALTFLHEYLHTPAGGNFSDPAPGSNFGTTGDVVDRINDIRSQLGSNYGQRDSYMGLKVNPTDVTAYIPFSKMATGFLLGKFNNGTPQAPISGYVSYTKQFVK